MVDIFNKELSNFLNSVENIFSKTKDSRTNFNEWVAKLDLQYPFLVTIILLAAHYRLCEWDETTSSFKILRDNIVANYGGIGYPVNLFIMYEFFLIDGILCKKIIRSLFSLTETDTRLLKERVFDFLWEFLTICCK